MVKGHAGGASMAGLAAALDRLQRVRTRHSAPVDVLCADYVAEKAAKAATEGLRRQARAALDSYRQNIFPAYEAAINIYLQRFNAGSRLASVSPVNTRGGSSCNYNVV